MKVADRRDRTRNLSLRQRCTNHCTTGPQAGGGGGGGARSSTCLFDNGIALLEYCQGLTQIDDAVKQHFACMILLWKKKKKHQLKLEIFEHKTSFHQRKLPDINCPEIYNRIQDVNNSWLNSGNKLKLIFEKLSFLTRKESFHCTKLKKKRPDWSTTQGP